MLGKGGRPFLQTAGPIMAISGYPAEPPGGPSALPEQHNNSYLVENAASHAALLISTARMSALGIGWPGHRLDGWPKDHALCWRTLGSQIDLWGQRRSLQACWKVVVLESVCDTCWEQIYYNFKYQLVPGLYLGGGEQVGEKTKQRQKERCATYRLPSLQPSGLSPVEVSNLELHPTLPYSGRFHYVHHHPLPLRTCISRELELAAEPGFACRGSKACLGYGAKRWPQVPGA